MRRCPRRGSCCAWSRRMRFAVVEPVGSHMRAPVSRRINVLVGIHGGFGRAGLAVAFFERNRRTAAYWRRWLAWGRSAPRVFALVVVLVERKLCGCVVRRRVGARFDVSRTEVVEAVLWAVGDRREAMVL